jgi:hypothetical protein
MLYTISKSYQGDKEMQRFILVERMNSTAANLLK